MFILKWKQLLHKRFVARDAYMHLKVSNREKFWTNMYSSFPTLHAPYKKLLKTLVEQNDFQCIHNWTYFNLKINENRGMNEIWEVYYLRLLRYKYVYIYEQIKRKILILELPKNILNVWYRIWFFHVQKECRIR